MITRWLMGGLGLAAVAAAGIAFWQGEKVDRFAAENARLERTVRTMELQAEQQAEAERVARAEADRWEARAAEYQAALDGLTEGVDDAPLDDRLRDRLNSVLTRPRARPDQDGDPRRAPAPGAGAE